MQYHDGRSSHCNKKRGTRQIRKEEIKLSLFTDNMITYVENPKESKKQTKTPRANELGKVSLNKVNTQKSNNCISIY